VMPGFGIVGLGGGALVIASLVLASLTFVAPHNSGDMRELVTSTGSVLMAIVSVFAVAVLSNYLLPQVPFFRRLNLNPPPAEERSYMQRQESVVDYSDLIGSQGVADHQLIDVIAEGEPLDSGTPIVVVDARGNRVVVRSVENA